MTAITNHDYCIQYMMNSLSYMCVCDVQHCCIMFISVIEGAIKLNLFYGWVIFILPFEIHMANVNHFDRNVSRACLVL